MRRRNRMKMIKRIFTLVVIALVIAGGLFFGAKTLVNYLNRDQNVEQEITHEQEKDTKVYKGTVVLDPGHDSTHIGASGNNVQEEILIFIIKSDERKNDVQESVCLVAYTCT